MADKNNISSAGRPLPPPFRTAFLAPYQGITSHSLYTEFLAVAAGLKPVLRTYAVLLDRYPALKARLAACGLAAERSDFRVSSANDTVLSSDGDSVYVYVSRSPKLAAGAKRSEEGILARAKPSYADSLAFSALMGYPRCCFEFFVRFVSAGAGRPSHLAEYEALAATSGAPSWYLNNLIRGDHYLISHYPCSYRCAPSLKYARALLAALTAARPALAARVVRLLKYPVLKFREKGAYVRLLGGRAGKSGAVLYRGCEGDEPLAGAFRSGDSLLPLKSSIRIFRGGAAAGVYRRRGPLDGALFGFE